MPQFLLKRLVLGNFPQGAVAPDVAASIDFVVEQLSTIARAPLASRLTLTTAPCYVEADKLFAQDLKVHAGLFSTPPRRA